jgi:hypothetical protein
MYLKIICLQSPLKCAEIYPLRITGLMPSPLVGQINEAPSPDSSHYRMLFFLKMPVANSSPQPAFVKRWLITGSFVIIQTFVLIIFILSNVMWFSLAHMLMY